MYKIQNLNKKITEGKMVIGSHVGFDSPFITEMMGGCGFDFIWIDGEHSALDKKDIQTHLLACRAAGVPGIVRVPWNDFVFIKGILDMGADGIIVPMIRSLEEAKQVVAATTYPPVGIRGLGQRRAANYGLWDVDDYTKNTRDKIWTILQIEHIDVIKDLEEIAKLPGITGFVVGPNDFTMSMNNYKKTYILNDPEVLEKFNEIGKILSKTGKPFGVSGNYSENFVKDWIARGVNFICMSFDFHYIIKGSKEVLEGTKNILASLGKDY